MAWLTTDALPMIAGWGGPPQYHAPEIGGLVSGILRNRLEQQKFQQDNIADAIKQYQQQRQEQAYTEALQKAGLLPEGDYGGIGLKGGASLADLLRRQKAEQALEEHRAGMLGLAQQRLGRGGGGGGEAPDEPETYTDDKGREWRRTRTGWTLIPKYGQSSITPQQTAQEEAVRPAYEAAQGAQAEAERRKKILEERFGAPQEGVLPATGFGEERKAKAQAKFLKRLQEEAAAQKTQQELGKKYPRLTTPQTDQGGGADKNLAQDYGQPVSDADVEALSWARAHPDDPRSAAILQKLGIQ